MKKGIATFILLLITIAVFLYLRNYGRQFVKCDMGWNE